MRFEIINIKIRISCVKVNKLLQNRQPEPWHSSPTPAPSQIRLGNLTVGKSGQWAVYIPKYYTKRAPSLGGIFFQKVKYEGYVSSNVCAVGFRWSTLNRRRH